MVGLPSSVVFVSCFVEDLRNPQGSWCFRWRSQPDLESCRHLHIGSLLRSFLKTVECLRDLFHRDRMLDAGVVLLRGPRARMAHDHAHHGDRHFRIDEPLTVGAPALAEIHVDAGLLRDLVGVHPRGVARKIPVRGDVTEEQRPRGRTDLGNTVCEHLDAIYKALPYRECSSEEYN